MCAESAHIWQTISKEQIRARAIALALLGVGFIVGVVGAMYLPERVVTYGIIAVGLVVALGAAWLGISRWRRGQPHRRRPGHVCVMF